LEDYETGCRMAIDRAIARLNDAKGALAVREYKQAAGEISAACDEAEVAFSEAGDCYIEKRNQ